MAPLVVPDFRVVVAVVQGRGQGQQEPGMQGEPGQGAQSTTPSWRINVTAWYLDHSSGIIWRPRGGEGLISLQALSQMVMVLLGKAVESLRGVALLGRVGYY